jgi:hypothetical protein
MEQLRPILADTAQQGGIGRVSIVIEWENVLLAGNSRAKQMLAQVIEQANRLPNCHEILISATSDQPALARRPNTLRDAIDWQLLIHPGQHYYELKNLGALQASGDLIAFVDSDVLPEDNWLEQLLAPLDEPSTQVCCGRAHIDTTNLYTKAFALFWFFPVRQRSRVQTGAPLVTHCWPTTDHFFANNIAFRRSTALAYPFPASKATSRGACLELSQQLHKAGIPIRLNSQAWVAHPPPQPGEHFVHRALAQGRDRYLRSSGLSRTILGSGWRWIRNSGRTLIKIAWLHQHVDLKWYEIPAAWLIGLAYYSLYWMGEIGTMLRLQAVLSISI